VEPLRFTAVEELFWKYKVTEFVPATPKMLMVEDDVPQSPVRVTKTLPFAAAPVRVTAEEVAAPLPIESASMVTVVFRCLVISVPPYPIFRDESENSPVDEAVAKAEVPVTDRLERVVNAAGTPRVEYSVVAP
jgi:hypothetical protein